MSSSSSRKGFKGDGDAKKKRDLIKLIVVTVVIFIVIFILYRVDFFGLLG